MRISDWSSDVCSSDLWWPHSLWPRKVAQASSWGWALSCLWLWRSAFRPCCFQSMITWQPRGLPPYLRLLIQPKCGQRRSEEHTSELQTLMRISYAVFCLKKKTNNYKKQNEYKVNV